MAYYCQLILGLGLLIALGIFTKTELWHAFGEYIITLPHEHLRRFGIARNTTGKIVSLGLMLLSLYGCSVNVSELGGIKETTSIMISFDRFTEDANKGATNALLSCTLATLVWAFILKYYVTQQDLHKKILGIQEENERAFVNKHCSQFRPEFTKKSVSLAHS